MTAKVPRTPSEPLTRIDADVLLRTPMLWRIHRVRGRYKQAWNELRTYGPLDNQRWDTHPLPEGNHPGHGVSYTGLDIATCAAEVFQATRRIEATNERHLSSWTPERPLRLLDLTGGWALRNQAAHALTAAPRATCRAWSRTIRETWQDLDGLCAPSTLTGRPNVVLFAAAADSFPPDPAYSAPLDDLLVWQLLQAITADIGYRPTTP